eukprot:scaffold9.g3084.t1
MAFDTFGPELGTETFSACLKTFLNTYLGALRGGGTRSAGGGVGRYPPEVLDAILEIVRELEDAREIGRPTAALFLKRACVSVADPKMENMVDPSGGSAAAAGRNGTEATEEDSEAGVEEEGEDLFSSCRAWLVQCSRLAGGPGQKA